jgi:hypothetical protein
MSNGYRTVAADRPSVVMDPRTPFKRLGPVSRLTEFITPSAVTVMPA